MKAIAINASPMMDKGNTAAILTPFLDGMREAGAEVEIYYTKKLNIKPCQGEFDCWFKTPGRCFQKDDMEMLLPRLAEAGIQVFATPLYVHGMSGPLKNLWDRLTPLDYPRLELRDGRSCLSQKEGSNTGKVVLVSNCGFWEMDCFEPLLAHMKERCWYTNQEFAGALLRPHGTLLKPMADSGAPVNDVFEAARAAGRQLVQEGEMSSQTLATVSRTLMPLEAYVQFLNRGFQQALGEMEST